MYNQIVDVQFEDGTISICKIINESQIEYLISELQYIGNEKFKFSTETIWIPKEAVSGFYDVTSLDETGLYVKVSDDVYESVSESDSDYEVSSEEDSETDISLCDED